MAEVQKPVVPETPAIVEPTVAETPAETKTEEPVAETPATAETPAEGAPAAEEKVTKVEKPVEPIYSGALGYKAPGLKNAFRYSKKYFWFGEEPVTAQSLSAYLRGEKPEVAHPTVAWSTQTGKGLLYFVKHADQKATPAGVLNLADATEVTKDGTVAFHFKLHGHKHAFEASTSPERNGWFLAVQTAVEEASAAKKELVESAGYKEQLEKLGKPAALAAASASTAKEATPKKSTDIKPTEAVPPRTASSSSSSENEEQKKKKASKSKSRSVSRGKRASVFGSLLGKKEKVEEKKEEKKEEKEEGKTGEEAEPSTAAAVEPVVAATEGPKEETPAPVTEATEAPKTEEAVAPVIETPETKPKPTKRGSIFGNFVEKLRSPTIEKKESDVAPPVPAKEETSTEAPKIEEPVTPVVTAEASEAPKAEETKTETPVTATTPSKEKEHFSFSKFLNKDKAKSPTTETPAPIKSEAEAPKAEEIPAVAETAEAPKEEVKTEEPVKEETTPPAAKAKRGSIFGSLTNSAKKEKTEGEVEPKKESKLTGLFRSASKAAKPLNKKKEEPAAPVKLEEKDEPKTEEPTAAAETKTEPSSEPQIIGDVVPDAVTVGQAPKSTPEVSATA